MRLQVRERISVVCYPQRRKVSSERRALRRSPKAWDSHGICCVTRGVLSMSECTTQSVLCSELSHQLSRGLGITLTQCRTPITRFSNQHTVSPIIQL